MAKERIREFILEHFPHARTRISKGDEPLLERGILDSLGILDLVGFLEQEFGIRIDDDDLVPDNFQTLERIAAFVAEKEKSVSRQLR